MIGTTLKAYLIRNQITVRSFSILADINQTKISKFQNGSLPSLENAYKIEQASDGKVPMGIWMKEKEDEEKFKHDFNKG